MEKQKASLNWAKNILNESSHLHQASKKPKSQEKNLECI